MINYSLYNFHDSHIIDFLSENNFFPQFSPLKKIYYNIVRPVMPLFIRHWLQEGYNTRINYFPDFIFTDFVDLLKQDQYNWNKFINNLYPEKKQCAIVLTHDVETQKGYDYIPVVLDMEIKYGFKSSWNIVPYKYKIHEDIIKLIKDNGHEIGIHGYNHDGKLYFNKEIFDFRVKYINEAIEKYGAVGFRSPMVHRNLEWLQQLNLKYEASCFDYDPFQPFPGGTGCIWPFKAGKFIELPYTLPQDHVLFYVLKQKNIDIWKNKVKWIVQNHGMILSLTHPDYLIEKSHLKCYEELLTFFNEIPNSWHCLPKEIAQHSQEVCNFINS